MPLGGYNRYPAKKMIGPFENGTRNRHRWGQTECSYVRAAVFREPVWDLDIATKPSVNMGAINYYGGP